MSDKSPIPTAQPSTFAIGYTELRFAQATTQPKIAKELSELYLVFLPLLIFPVIIFPLARLGVKDEVIIGVLLFLVFLFVRYNRMWFPDWVKKKDIIGTVFFTEDRIITKKNDKKKEIEY